MDVTSNLAGHGSAAAAVDEGGSSSKAASFNLVDVTSHLAGHGSAAAAGGSSKAASFSLVERLKGEHGGGGFIATTTTGSSKKRLRTAAARLPEELSGSGVIKEFVCKECGKGFRSGKALGGHISSAHVQAKANLKSKRCMLKFPCVICHNDFSSKKSLYGHMRFHPDRHWRGMVAPRGGRGEIDNFDFSKQGESSIGPDDYHLTNFVGDRWKETGKRGQKLGVKLLDFADGEEELMLIKAAADLLHLAAGKSSSSSVTGSKDLVAGRKRNRNMAAAVRHLCDVCEKEFQTGQALGGHKRRHYTAPSSSPTGRIGEEKFDLNMPPAEEVL